MRVAYILNAFPKISETFILNEIIEVQNNGIDVEVFAFSSSSKENISHSKVNQVKHVSYLSAEKKSLGLLIDHLFWFLKNPFQYLKTLGIALNRKNEIFRLFVLNLHNVRMIVRGKPDMLHAHFGTRPADTAMLIHLLTGIPYTFTTHGYDVFFSLPRNYRFKSRLAVKVIAISQYNKNYLIKHFDIPTQCIDVIHCGIDFINLPRASKAKVNNQIICIARFEKVKRLDQLIEACSLLKDRLDFQCLLVGDGSLRAELVGLIDKLSLKEHVHLLGYKTSDELFELLSQSAVMVLTSQSEGIPVSLMESMALKTPVIATRITGIPELIADGISGFLFEVGDISDLANKIERIMKNDARCNNFCAQAYEKVLSDFNLAIEVKKLIGLWKVKESSKTYRL